MTAAEWIPIVVERIVHDFHPLQIILFGSQARGTAQQGSDIDLLIVGDRSPDETWSRRREIGRIRRSLENLIRQGFGEEKVCPVYFGLS